MSVPYFETIDNKGNRNNNIQAAESDVCLLLEGTYPFVSGGVSSWVHSLIKGLPELTFSLLIILPDEKKRKEKFKLPPNVTDIYILYLNRKSFSRPPLSEKILSQAFYDKIKPFHGIFSKVKKPLAAHGEVDDLTTDFGTLSQWMEKETWNIRSMMYAKKSWRAVKQYYSDKNNACSFMDYYWTWRYVHSSIFAIMQSYIPKAKVYHAVSTGYAGFFGAKAVAFSQRPLLLTEHGIYTKEREIEISRSPWIYESDRHLYRAQEDIEIFKEIWIRSFQIMSKLCYDTSSEIITLYSGNQRYQLEIGAPQEKLSIIPNGVDYKKLSSLTRQPQPKKIIGFVGRIVPIKDVKTFLRAASLVLNSYSKAEIWLLGPTDENPLYYEECQELVEHLEIQDKVKFWGMVNLVDFYPKLDILVLTSISEAQPLVILEAYCLKIPVVATDVGACMELTEGSSEEDKALGKSGLITGLANPTETAIAILELLNNEAMAKAMGEAGEKRVRLIYDLDKLFDRYRELYRKYIDWKME